uniref:Os01g0778700 protein n=1 Tax=Macrostomum lignano TaxID=282301 RepID=A0A1I8I782_9PLAT
KKRIRRSSHSSSSGQRQSSSPRSTTPADVSRSCWPLWPMAPTRAKRLRGRGLSYQLSHSALLTKHRVRPLKPPAAAPAATPAWQLIRPRPRRRPTVPLSDLPRRSGSDNDSDDGERGRGPEDDAEETSPIRAVEIDSPFFAYMVTDQLHQRRPASRPTSSLSRRSTRRQSLSPQICEVDDESADPPPRRLPRRLPRLPHRLPCRLLRLPRRHHSHQPLLRRLW